MSHRLTARDIPAPSRSDWLGRFVCVDRVPISDDSWAATICYKTFWSYANYEVHWLIEHAIPKKDRPTPQPPMSVEEEGRRLASRRDDLIALGVPSELLAVPHAPRHRSPFNVKNALVMEHGPAWAPLVINVDGVNYLRYDGYAAAREDT